MSYTFSGPSAAGLVPSLAGAACVGLVYSSIANTSYQPVFLLMARSIADYALYQFATYLTSRNRAVIYACTTSIVNIGTLIQFRREELIGMRGTACYLLLIGLELLCKTRDFSKFRA